MVFEHLFPVGDQHRAASPHIPPSPKSDEDRAPGDRDYPAAKFSEIPVRGWKDILLLIFNDISKHRILALAAGMTYYSILAWFPAIGALVAVYGLFPDPSTIARHLDQLGGFLPGGALEVARDDVVRNSRQREPDLPATTFFPLQQRSRRQRARRRGSHTVLE